MGSLSGGYTQGLCGWPRGHDKEGNKSAQHLVKEINYYAHGNECLFDKKKGYMVTLFGPYVLRVAFRRRRSVNDKHKSLLVL